MVQKKLKVEVHNSKWPSPHVFTLCIVPSHMELWLACASVSYLQKKWSEHVWLLRVGHERHCSSLHTLLFPWISKSGESQVPCHENTQAILWRGPHGEGLRNPAHSQHKFASHMSEPSWKCILQPQSSLQLTAALDNIMTATLWKILYRIYLTQLFPSSFLSHNSIPSKCYHCWSHKALG